MKTRWAAAWLALTLTATAAEPELGDPHEKVLTFRVRPGVKAETLRKIAELTTMRTAVVNEPITVQSLLREEYGSSHESLQMLFARYNNGERNDAVLQPGQEITLPAGPEWGFDAKMVRRKAVPLSDQIVMQMGVAGPKTRALIEELNKRSFETMTQWPEGTAVRLPYVSRVVSEKIRRERLEGIAATLEDLKKDPAVEFVDVSSTMTIVPPWTDAVASGTACGFPEPGAGAVQPSPVKEETLKHLPKVRTTVAVLDSGVVVGDARFQFWRNARETENNVDDDDNRLIDDVIGYDFVHRRGKPVDDLASGIRMYHGTHVAGVAGQRLTPPTLRAEIDQRVDLMILKVADSVGLISPDSVMNAVAYATDAGARVVNMSFDSRYQYALEWAMKRAPSLLFVVAAGNAHSGLSPSDVDQADIYPAKLSKDLTNVISVAAVDPALKVACFSNYGAKTIDIAAPGVWVNSTVEASGTRMMSGSSQAAPVVAYLAALLTTSGLKTPQEIRNRIVDSADFLPALKGKVKAEGVVNAEKALLYATDLVQKADGSVLTGRITFPTVLTFPDGETISTSKVRKIVPRYDPVHPFRVTVDQGGKRVFHATSLALDAVQIQTSGGLITVPMADIADVVFAVR